MDFTENDTIKFDVHATTEEALKGTSYILAEYIFNAVKETGDESVTDVLFQEFLHSTAVRYNELAAQANEKNRTQEDNVITIVPEKLSK